MKDAHLKCPYCGNDKFRGIIQAIPTDGREWDFEYLCNSCGRTVYLTRAERRRVNSE